MPRLIWEKSYECSKGSYLKLIRSKIDGNFLLKIIEKNSLSILQIIIMKEQYDFEIENTENLFKNMK